VAKAKRKRPAAWHAEALDYLQAYQARYVEALCSLPDLYAQVVEKHGVSIGLFHDWLRDMVHAGQVRLHPFSGPRSALDRGELALVMNREIMYYAERIV
jgi:hypothetical protein